MELRITTEADWCNKEEQIGEIIDKEYSCVWINAKN